MKNLKIILFFQFFSLILYAQENIVTGNVKDSNGDVLPGASVIVKGTNYGAITDFDGNFKINLKDKKNVELIFSYVGYTDAEVAVGDKTNIDVILYSGNQLDEVVVIGYGTQTKKDVTGALAVADAEDLPTMASGNFLDNLQGQISGVQVNSTSGAPGAGINVSIRGASSIDGGTQPLYVIDGVPVEAGDSNVAVAENDQNSGLGDMSFINPSDIESMTVLKDAAATAVYGARGANGVVVITTKSGGQSGNKLSVNLTTFVDYLPNQVPVLNMEEYVQMRHYNSPGGSPLYSTNSGDQEDPTWIAREYHPDSIVNVNLQDEVFRPALSQQVNIAFNSGTENSKTAASLGYLKKNGIVKYTDYERFTTMLKYKMDVNKHVSLSSNINGSMGRTNAVRGNAQGNSVSAGIIQSVLNSTPGYVITDPSEENPDEEFDDELDGELSGPLELLRDGTKITTLNRLIASLALDVNITNDLRFRSRYSGQVSSSQADLFYPRTLSQGRRYGGRAILKNTSSRRMDWQNTLTYNTSFDVVRMTLLGGFELGNQVKETRETENRDFAVGAGGIYNIQEGVNPQIPTSFQTKNQYTSYFSRAQFQIKDKYLFSASFRGDGSSKFGENNKWGHFYAFAAGWTLSNESFLAGADYISLLKLRASYGTTGNDRIPDGLTRTNYQIGYYPDSSNNNVMSFGIANLGNPNLKWETTTQANIGIDGSMFNNRLNFTADAYYKKTEDLLLNLNIPAYYGIGVQVQNIGRIDNSGIELSISGDIIRNSKFNWFASFTATRNISEIIDLGGPTQRLLPQGTSTFREIGILRVGEPVGSFYGYVYDGIYDFEDFKEFDQYTTREAAAKSYSPNITYTLKEGVTDIDSHNVHPGAMKFKNLTDDDGGENLITQNDRTTIGNGNPDVFGGFVNRFTFGKFNVDLFFNYSLGNEIFYAGRFLRQGGKSKNHNITKEFWSSTWKEDGGVYNDYSIRDRQGSSLESSYYVEDGSYVRLKSLNVAYNFDLPENSGFRGLRIFANANNLLTFTKYGGFDPEIQGINKLVRGVDRGSYPVAVSISVGINANF